MVSGYKILYAFVVLQCCTSIVFGLNIDCKGKAFHCVNSTHFNICVDLGGGVSTTVDDFLLPCPENTYCMPTNYYECEYHETTTTTSTTTTVATTTIKSDLSAVNDGLVSVIPLLSNQKKSEVTTAATHHDADYKVSSAEEILEKPLTVESSIKNGSTIATEDERVTEVKKITSAILYMENATVNVLDFVDSIINENTTTGDSLKEVNNTTSNSVIEKASDAITSNTNTTDESTKGVKEIFLVDNATLNVLDSKVSTKPEENAATADDLKETNNTKSYSEMGKINNITSDRNITDESTKGVTEIFLVDKATLNVLDSKVSTKPEENTATADDLKETINTKSYSEMGKVNNITSDRNITDESTKGVTEIYLVDNATLNVLDSINFTKSHENATTADDYKEKDNGKSYGEMGKVNNITSDRNITDESTKHVTEIFLVDNATLNVLDSTDSTKSTENTTTADDFKETSNTKSYGEIDNINNITSDRNITDESTKGVNDILLVDNVTVNVLSSIDTINYNQNATTDDDLKEVNKTKSVYDELDKVNNTITSNTINTNKSTKDVEEIMLLDNTTINYFKSVDDDLKEIINTKSHYSEMDNIIITSDTNITDKSTKRVNITTDDFDSVINSSSYKNIENKTSDDSTINLKTTIQYESEHYVDKDNMETTTSNIFLPTENNSIDESTRNLTKPLLNSTESPEIRKRPRDELMKVEIENVSTIIDLNNYTVPQYGMQNLNDTSIIANVTYNDQDINSETDFNKTDKNSKTSINNNENLNATYTRDEGNLILLQINNTPTILSLKNKTDDDDEKKLDAKKLHKEDFGDDLQKTINKDNKFTNYNNKNDTNDTMLTTNETNNRIINTGMVSNLEKSNETKMVFDDDKDSKVTKVINTTISSVLRTTTRNETNNRIINTGMIFNLEKSNKTKMVFDDDIDSKVTKVIDTTISSVLQTTKSDYVTSKTNTDNNTEAESRVIKQTNSSDIINDVHNDSSFKLTTTSDKYVTESLLDDISITSENNKDKSNKKEMSTVFSNFSSEKSTTQGYEVATTKPLNNVSATSPINDSNSVPDLFKNTLMSAFFLPSNTFVSSLSKIALNANITSEVSNAPSLFTTAEKYDNITTEQNKRIVESSNKSELLDTTDNYTPTVIKHNSNGITVTKVIKSKDINEELNTNTNHSMTTTMIVNVENESKNYDAINTMTTDDLIEDDSNRLKKEITSQSNFTDTFSDKENLDTPKNKEPKTDDDAQENVDNIYSRTSKPFLETTTHRILVKDDTKDVLINYSEVNTNLAASINPVHLLLLSKNKLSENISNDDSNTHDINLNNDSSPQNMLTHVDIVTKTNNSQVNTTEPIPSVVLIETDRINITVNGSEPIENYTITIRKSLTENDSILKISNNVSNNAVTQIPDSYDRSNINTTHSASAENWTTTNNTQSGSILRKDKSKEIINSTSQTDISATMSIPLESNNNSKSLLSKSFDDIYAKPPSTTQDSIIEKQDNAPNMVPKLGPQSIKDYVTSSRIELQITEKSPPFKSENTKSDTRSTSNVYDTLETTTSYEYNINAYPQEVNIKNVKVSENISLPKIDNPPNISLLMVPVDESIVLKDEIVTTTPYEYTINAYPSELKLKTVDESVNKVAPNNANPNISLQNESVGSKIVPKDTITTTPSITPTNTLVNVLPTRASAPLPTFTDKYEDRNKNIETDSGSTNLPNTMVISKKDAFMSSTVNANSDFREANNSAKKAYATSDLGKKIVNVTLKENKDLDNVEASKTNASNSKLTSNTNKNIKQASVFGNISLSNSGKPSNPQSFRAKSKDMNVGLNNGNIALRNNITNKQGTFMEEIKIKIAQSKTYNQTQVTNVSKNNNTTAKHNKCLNQPNGKYADQNDCRKFYLCLGDAMPAIGECPNGTVFSESKKQCTKNLSQCYRNNQFTCLSSGRYYDLSVKNVYYICVRNRGKFIKFKLQCQSGYSLNETIVKCIKNSTATQNNSDTSSTKEDSTSISVETKAILKSKSAKKDEFECEKEGKFPHPKKCNKYYLCSKIKSVYSQKLKACESGEIFDKEKQKCVDTDSQECK